MDPVRDHVPVRGRKTSAVAVGSGSALMGAAAAGHQNRAVRQSCCGVGRRRRPFPGGGVEELHRFETFNIAAGYQHPAAQRGTTGFGQERGGVLRVR